MAKTKSVETPLMKQYNAIKAKYPGTVLLFRVGDFYETFGEDAITVSGILDIVLTKRANGSASEIELAGFPHHSLDNYLPRLVRAGQRVAVCDQLEDPKQAKGIVKRGVTELVTPGVALNDKILEKKESNYLAAVHFFSPKDLGMSVIEVSTGDFFCYTGDLSHVEKLIHTLKPSEIIVPRKDMRRFRTEVSDKYYVTRLEDWVFQSEYGRERLLEQFGTQNLKGFGIEGQDASLVAAGAILHYLRETAQAQMSHISRIYAFDDSDFVWLDPFTIRNLELIHPLHPDGKALVDVLDKTATPMGARLLRRWLLFPHKDLKVIQKRQKAVEAMIKDPASLDKLREILKQCSDLERLVSKLAARRIQPREAHYLRETLRLTEPLKAALAEFGEPALNKLLSDIADTSGALKVLSHFLEDDPSNNLATGGVVRRGVDEKLDEYRDLKEGGKEHLVKMQQREIERTGITSLKIGFNKVFGYYLEVTHAHKDKVPDDFIRKQTLTNAERYITDELKVYEEKILHAEERMILIEQRLYETLLDELMAFLPDIQGNAAKIAALDVLAGFAIAAKEYGYTMPTLNKGDKIDIRAGRHPVIERSLSRDDPYIPNDVFLDNATQQIIIITGPNMAGKSALLRQTALITLLAQTGSFVPADAAEIGLVDKIFTRVGASDNISSGESTFMVEMNETARIVNNATKRSLILLDEIGRGTSTYDGVSIAWALVEHLHENKQCAAKTLFATHYHELNEIEGRLERVRNYNVSVREVDGRVIFMRKLLPGGSAHSFGINVAALAGMPKKVVERAGELLHHFESSRMSDQEAAKSVKFADTSNFQLNMFELQDEDTLRIRQILSGLDIDRMTPVEALLKLQEIKKALVEGE